ncbi:hypothetical protein B0H11DRAFT_1921604 [Mycena galericulata]|nr:hypothetical protein B0H11DRAFT_1921604 [Mycena galericulata]
MDRNILPEVGAFVVLTINPMASLDEATLVEFLLQGEPEDSPEKCIEPSMSVPILPITREASRIPLKPSNPLPWNDCYVSTFWGASVRSPSLWTEDQIDCILDIEEFDRHTVSLIKDRWRYEALVAQKKVENPMPTPISAAPRGELATDVYRETHCDYPNLDEEELGDPFFYNPADKQMITVNFTHDLSTVSELNDPAEFDDEVEAIARIQQQARERNMKANARAIRAAAEIDAGAYDEHIGEKSISWSRAFEAKSGEVSQFIFHPRDAKG